MAYTPGYILMTQPNAPGNYKQKAKAPKEYKINNYKSQYAPQLESALNNVVNWKYDPMQDASYQALAKIYGARGNTAAKDTLADAAGLNGGMQTSYAVSAAQQARNQYNQELAALIPGLENTAYTRAQGTLGALRDADDTAYGRFRDTEGDRQWKYGVDYQAYRDKVADNQWLYSQNYNAYRDLMSDYQWAANWNMDLYQWNKAQEEAARASSGGGGGGGRSGGGGSSGGGYVGGYDANGLDDLINKASERLNEDNKSKKKTTKEMYSGGPVSQGVSRKYPNYGRTVVR